MESTAPSFRSTRIREQGPELICPSHGEPFNQADAGIADLIDKLRGWYTAYAPGGALTVDNKPYAVTPHLVASYQTTSSFYALISDSGKALFVDYGSASGNIFNVYKNGASVHDRMGFVEHTVPQLKAQFGLKSVDVIMPSHMHDDHLNGFPHLVRHHGAKVWCYENMVDVLQNPRGYNLGCILGEPIKIDRAFRNGETFKWEEYEFQVFHSPGHTEYQMAMFVTIDGARVAFTGDAFFPTGSADSLLRHNLIFRNWVENDSHVKSIKTILEHEPNIVAPGHGKPFLSNKADLENLKCRLEDQQKYFFAAIADPDCNFGLNPSWARFYPYQLQAKAGSSANLELRVRNYRSHPMHLEAALVLPAGWKASPELLDLTIPPGQDGSAAFSVIDSRRLGPSKAARRPGRGHQGGRQIPGPNRRGRCRYRVQRVGSKAHGSWRAIVAFNGESPFIHFARIQTHNSHWRNHEAAMLANRFSSPRHAPVAGPEHAGPVEAHLGETTTVAGFGGVSTARVSDEASSQTPARYHAGKVDQ